MSVVIVGGNERMITLFFAVLMWAFILREVDFDKMGLPDAAVFMLYGKGRAIPLVAGFSIAIIGAAIKFRHYFKATLSFLLSALAPCSGRDTYLSTGSKSQTPNSTRKASNSPPTA